MVVCVGVYYSLMGTKHLIDGLVWGDCLIGVLLDKVLDQTECDSQSDQINQSFAMTPGNHP